MGGRITGRYGKTVIDGEEVRAFLPHPLPPSEPPLVLEGPLLERLRLAEQALGKLELTGQMFRSLDWVTYALVRKEALASAQLDGNRATLLDWLAFEVQGESARSNADAQELCDAVTALDLARSQLAHSVGAQLSMRLLSDAHRCLLRSASSTLPGEMRRGQTPIGLGRGSAALVPPPPSMLPGLLGAFEAYLQAQDVMPTLIRGGLLYGQFLSISPYFEGNARLGRLLIGLVLEERGVLTRPLLYLSLFFQRYRHECQRLVDGVRAEGDWESWLGFFLVGVRTIADEAVALLGDLFALLGADRTRLLASDNGSVPALRLLELLPTHPLITIASAMKLLQTTKPTASRAVESLTKAGILQETTGRNRDRRYLYRRYLNRLAGNTEANASKLASG